MRPGETSSPSILVIDDDDSVRRALCAALENAGYRVLEAADGRTGLRLYEDERPQLVITDIIMPDVEGIETIRGIRKLGGNVAIIAISGGRPGGIMNYLPAAKLLGADMTLEKPFRLPDLLAHVERLLTGSFPQS